MKSMKRIAQMVFGALLNNNLSGSRAAFTLAEMMVVLLIVSIFLAAMAPVMTTRMKRSQDAKESQTVVSDIWKWQDNKSGIYFSTNDPDEEKSVMIGQKEAGSEDPSALLVLNSAENKFNYQILFKQNNYIGGGLLVTNNKIMLGTSERKVNNSVVIGNEVKVASGAGADSVMVGNGIEAKTGSSVLIGYGANTINGTANSNSVVAIGYQSSGSNGTIAIGNNATAKMGDAIAIGNAEMEVQNEGPDEVVKKTIAANWNSIAIGNTAQSLASSSIAIGRNMYIPSDAANAIAIGTPPSTGNSIGAGAVGAIAIGDKAQAKGMYSIAIGSGAEAQAKASVAIGQGVVANHENQIVLGTKTSTVYIPGDLVVGGRAYIGDSLNYDNSLFLNWKTEYMREIKTLNEDKLNNRLIYGDQVATKYSDRRLKYVGKENKDGLDKIRQIKVFNYTFKKDKTKEPHVGVIAQDLQKIFPNAVKKAADGFLTIRMEDMFYALVNAVKELDMNCQAQEKTINELESHLNNLEKRIEKLEVKRK